MPTSGELGRRFTWAWAVLLLLLLAVRLPSLIQPAGGDQGLYAYAAQRILAGDVMYRDMWDQKPPGIAFVYALLSLAWPHESIVPAADLASAALVAALLVALGRLRFTLPIGFGAAAIFLLFGDPYLQRLSGIYVRGQCEPFMALAVVAGLFLLARHDRRPAHVVAAGVALAAAVWLKYNAAAYGLTFAAAIWAWNPVGTPRAALRDATWVAYGFAGLSAVALAYFAANGALLDLRLATIDYNLRYSQETYEGSINPLRYLATFPFERARIDMIWFLGGLGTLLAAAQFRKDRSTIVVAAWMAGALLSITLNGSRSLPNYFVQANPALALAASVGFATLVSRGRLVRLATAALVLAAVWRVGADTPVWGMRLATLPGLAENVRYDLDGVRGRLDRDAYLERFRGQKHDAFENERLVRYINETTRRDEPIFVFGFSGGSVCWKSGRSSASRFYWSRPVLIEFASERRGYGSSGLLEELERERPTVVALQAEEWQSKDFFMTHPRLRAWLEQEYVHEHDTPMFSVWRRKS